MFRIARLLFSLGGAQFGEFRAHTGRRVLFSTLLGIFGVIAVVFGLVAATALLASHVGTIRACAIMAGAALFCCLVVFVLMKIAESRHRALVREQEETRQRLTQLALLAASGAGRPTIGKVIGVGLAAAAVMIFLGRSGRGGDEG